MLAELLLQSGAVRFGEFTLRSGQTSDVYVDIKHAWTRPDRLRVLAGALARRVGAVDVLAGMELGAVPLVVATALETGKPYVVIRKAAKDHGTARRFEGDLPPGSRVLVLEDVTSTGGAALGAVEVVREAGGLVDRVLVVVDRRMGARDRLRRAGVRLEALVTLDELREAPA
jgi:orotate phosphoribosyltransferase